MIDVLKKTFYLSAQVSVSAPIKLRYQTQKMLRTYTQSLIGQLSVFLNSHWLDSDNLYFLTMSKTWDMHHAQSQLIPRRIYEGVVNLFQFSHCPSEIFWK